MHICLAHYKLFKKQIYLTISDSTAERNKGAYKKPGFKPSNSMMIFTFVICP